MRLMRKIYFFAAVITVTCWFGQAASAQHEDHKEVKKAFMLHGKVEAIDASAKKVTVNHEKIEGLMDAMTMAYGVDKPETLDQIKVGDQIEATLYKGNYTLHNIKVVKPKR